MIPVADMAALLLCAGLSRRFGAADKLLHRLDDRPLALHVADTIASLPFALRIAVVRDDAVELREMLSARGYRIVVNSNPELGRQHSVALGMASALQANVAGVTLFLGDMPFVTSAHLRALSDAASPDQAAASSNGAVMSPPCVFPRELSVRIAAGEIFARDALTDAAIVTGSPAMLADFDTMDDFAAVAARSRFTGGVERLSVEA